MAWLAFDLGGVLITVGCALCTMPWMAALISLLSSFEPSMAWVQWLGSVLVQRGWRLTERTLAFYTCLNLSVGCHGALQGRALDFVYWAVLVGGAESLKRDQLCSWWSCACGSGAVCFVLCGELLLQRPGRSFA